MSEHYCEGHVYTDEDACPDLPNWDNRCRDDCGHPHPGTQAWKAAIGDEALALLWDMAQFIRDEAAMIEDGVPAFVLTPVYRDRIHALLARTQEQI